MPDGALGCEGGGSGTMTDSMARTYGQRILERPSRCIAKELPKTSEVLSFGNTAGAVLDAPDEAQHSSRI
jgi:hypothetical protein